MSTVSVIIPCYNREALLPEAIESVRRQTRAPSEVIVVDDCSSDRSASVARRLGARVLSTPVNMGDAAARNLGLAAAEGELVAWLDSDDVWEARHLETVVPLLDRHPEVVVAFGLVREFGDRTGEWPPLLPAGIAVDAFEACIRRCAVPHMSVIVRREAVLAAGGYNESIRLGNDYDLWLRLSLRHPFACTHEVTAGWRQHGAQLSRGSRVRMMEYWTQEYLARERLWAVLQESGPGERAAQLERVSQETLEGHLADAWYGRDAEYLRFHLAHARHVPNSDGQWRRWRGRAALLGAARFWDVMPWQVKRPVRALRRLVHRTAGGVQR